MTQFWTSIPLVYVVSGTELCKIKFPFDSQTLSFSFDGHALKNTRYMFGETGKGISPHISTSEHT